MIELDTETLRAIERDPEKAKAFLKGLGGTEEQIREHCELLERDLLSKDLNEFDSNVLSNMVWSFTLTDFYTPTLYKRFEDHFLAADLTKYKRGELQNILFAFSHRELNKASPEKLRFDQLFDKIDHLLTHHVDWGGASSSCSFCSMVAWSYLSTGRRSAGVFAKMEQYYETVDFNKVSPGTVAALVGSYARAGNTNTKVYAKVASFLLSVDDYSPYDVKTMKFIVFCLKKNGTLSTKLNNKLAAFYLEQQRKSQEAQNDNSASM
jgi:hypothetical protein